MANRLNHPGLIEALIDFGADQSSYGLQVQDMVWPTLALGDVSLNYEPALRARLHTTIDLVAAGAGNYNALSIQASVHGFWLTEIRALTGAWHMRVHASPVIGAATPLGFNVIGQTPGEVRVVSGATDFFGNTANPARSVVTIDVPLGDSLRVGIQGIGLALPLWVPGNCWLNAQQSIANTAILGHVAIQVPALNAGRFP